MRLISRKVLAVWLGMAALSAHGGSFRWTLHGPLGGEATKLFLSPQRQLWMLSSGLLFRRDASVGEWRFVPLDTPADFASSIAFDPTDEQHLYVSTELGRVLRSTDGGTTLQGDFLVPGSAVADVEVDPHSPNVVLACVRSRGVGGVFRSTDSGLHWTRAGLPGSATYLLRIDPDVPGRVYATSGGADGGIVYRSDNGGLSFAVLGVNGTETDPREVDYGSSALRKNVFYAAVRAGVVKSVDGGRQWFPTRLEVTATGLARRGDLLLASSLNGLHLTRDAGNTWTPRGPEDNLFFQQRMNDVLMDGDDVYVATRLSGVIKSRDLGDSYEAINRGFFGQRLLSMDVHPVRGDMVVGASSAAGVYFRSGGNPPGAWRSIGTALAFSSPAMIAVLDRVNPRKLYVASRSSERFGVFTSEDSGTTWRDVTINLGNEVPVLLGMQPNKEGLGSLFVGTSSGMRQFSVSANAWFATLQGTAGAPLAIAFDTSRPSRVFLGTSQSIYRSDDGGQSATDISGPIRELCRRSPGTLPQLCVGDPNQVALAVLDIEVDPSDGNRVYVALRHGGVWRSTQGGAGLAPYLVLQAQPGGPLLDEVTAVAVHPSRSQELYFGTGLNGVLRTTNGSTLEVFNENLVYPRVADLMFTRRQPLTLYARLESMGIASYSFGQTTEPALTVRSMAGIWRIVAAILAMLVGSVAIRGSGRPRTSRKRGEHFWTDGP